MRCQLFRATLSDRLVLARRSESHIFPSRKLHEFVEIKCPSPIRSDFPKIDVIPTIHSGHPIPFLADAHWFARDHSVDNFFVVRT
jgi:hypothetical protein